jgi:hypothetical protein
MTDFKVGDRVCVRALRATRIHAGKTGEVVAVKLGSLRAQRVYGVRLDAGSATPVSFWSEELEPEAVKAR